MKELLSLQFTIFVLIAVGVLVKKKKIIGTAGQKNITDLVIYVVLPCNTVMSFLNGKVDSSLGDCVTVLVISVVIQIFCVAYGKIAYSKEKGAKKKCLQYGIICSNAGFLGNPIAEGIYGSTGLMLASIYLIPLRIMMWSEGLRVFSGSADKKETVKKVITHPCVLACLIGLVLMLLPVSLPEILLNPVNTIGRCNTALSMFVIGMILADIDPKNLVDWKVVRYTVERLVLIPLLVYACCSLFHVGRLITGLSVILAAMPAGATTSMLAAKYDQAPQFATKLVIFSTLCSIPSICVWSIILA